MRKLIAGGLTGVIAAMLFASSALAASHNPTGEYAGFNECPLNRATITDCVVSLSNGGYFTIGKKKVPLVKPVKLQGGFEGVVPNIKFYGAENGDTLSKTPQPVPGGLLGIVAPTWWPGWAQEWFNELINEGFTGVSATVELTGPTKGLTNITLNTVNLLSETGTALGLPAKIHLENAILGGSCYIGSEKAPVQINFTSGTDGALKGAAGKVTFNPEFTISTISGGKLVNNSFLAPESNGCGGIFSFFVGPLVDSIIGLPAGKGVNSAVLEGKIEDGIAEAVVLSEP
jgi:hypothetical protein